MVTASQKANVLVVDDEAIVRRSLCGILAREGYLCGEAGDAIFMLSGASKVELDGSAKDINVNASGASQVKLSRFSVDNAQVLLSGASTGTIYLDGTLDADLSGASKLSYIGEPTMGNVNTSGGSTLSKK